MTQRRFRNRSDFNHSAQQIVVKILQWTLVVFMLFQQLNTTVALKFNGDHCVSKNKPGICKVWSECPILKTLIESGEYTNREVVNCGFGVREEIICCPVGTETKNENTSGDAEDSSEDRSTTSTITTTTTTTEGPVKDFWLDLLASTTSSTTNKPDFWLDLLKPTTTTTPKPLMVGEHKLNENSEFFDFNALLGQKQNGENKQKLQALPADSSSNQAGFAANGNGPNQFGRHQISSNFNNAAGEAHFNNGPPQMFGNGNGNFAWAQQNNVRVPWNGHINFNRHHNMGKGLHNLNNNWHAHGQHNNGPWQNQNQHQNQNQGLGFPQNNMRGNNAFGKLNVPPIRRPGTPVNNMPEQNPNLPVFQNDNKPISETVNNNDKKKVDDFINKLFDVSDSKEEDSSEEIIANIFNLNKSKNPFLNPNRDTNRPQTVVWSIAQNNNNDHYIPTWNPQKDFINPLPSRHSEITTATDNQLNTNDLEAAPSKFVQQPALIQTWPTNTVSNPTTLQEPDIKPLLNVQSPPRQVLHTIKPIEFQPPRDKENNYSEDNNSLSPNPNNQPDPKPGKDRPAVRACNRIERGLNASLTIHILGGTPAEMGEFPHMVAIGYSRIGGDDKPPYDIRCGGTLIDKRFVLTAAHCVSERENVPSIVRLGVVNFHDEIQMSSAVELRINQTYIHDDYRSRLTYNDIAILELERDVEYTPYIYPVCLYTELQDPDPKIKLWVTGWGTVNITTRTFSDILLKAPLHTAPLEHCNQSFTEYGLNRRIPEGIRRTQFCAEDKDQVKDACQGDSGGPLNLIKDESYNNYRLVGVVSSGFGCASSTPGLYTRVAAYLDFIEKIVWPNGGD